MASSTMLTVATFGMAPGGYTQIIEDYWSQYGSVATANALAHLAHLDGSSNYRTLADTVTQNLLGSVSADKFTMVSDWLYSQLNDGQSAGYLINLLSDVIDNISHTDTNWGSVATRFDNIRDVSEYYFSMAGAAASTDMTALRHYVLDVTDDSSILAQIRAEIDDAFGGGSGGGGTDDNGTAMPEEFLALQSLVTLNDHTGILSTASLRAAIIAETSEAAYNEAFDPTNYDSGDGTLTASDLGLTQFSSLPATVETVESLYFGTSIKALQSIDQAEIMEIGSYVAAHQAELQGGALPQEYVNLLVNMFSDPGNPPLFSDSMIADAIITGGIVFVQAVTNGDIPSLFDFTSFAG